MPTGHETCPLPEHPALAEWAKVLRDAGHWGQIADRDWRLVYMTDEGRLSEGAMLERVPLPLGEHMFGPTSIDTRVGWRGHVETVDAWRAAFNDLGGYVLADTPGGREALRDLVHPALRDMVDGLKPAQMPPVSLFRFQGINPADKSLNEVQMTMVRVHDADGTFLGIAMINKPAVGMATLATMVIGYDAGHLGRMQSVIKPGRRAAAILFADLEGSSALAKRLSTASYFALGRRLVRAADACVVDAGGLVGRHVGDGIVAFFLAETAGSESPAARACIGAARALRAALHDVAVHSDLDPGAVVLRFGLHSGSTLYVGQIATRGRTEVNALGDQVNEAARIEACATGGLALASKDLIERLEPDDAAALDLETNHVTYTQLANLSTATEKARRDAPAIAVCEI